MHSLEQLLFILSDRIRRETKNNDLADDETSRERVARL
jgi:hypothetical protein